MARKINVNNLLVRFTNSLADMIYLSCLWLIGCIPILTVGTSTTAVYYAAMKSIRGEGSTAKNFRKAYQENLKQSICVDAIILGAVCILYGLIRAAASTQSALASLLQILFVILSFPCLILLSCLFPLLSRFEQSTPVLFRNALLISFSNFPYAVVVTILNLSPLLLFAIWPTGFMRLLLVVLFFLPGLIVRVNSMILMRVFQKYMPEDEAESLQAAEDDEDMGR